MSNPEQSAEQPEDSPAWRADLALFAVAVMWGVNVPIIKRGVELIDRLAFNSLRLTLSAAVLGLLVLRERKKTPVQNRPWMQILFVAFLTGFVYQLTFVLGVPRTLSGNTALILSATPMWTALIAWLVGMDKLKPIAWAGLVVTCAGAGLIAFSPSETNLGGEYVTGNMLILLASVMWAVGSILSKPLFEYVTPTQLAFLSSVITLPAHYAVAGRTTIDAVQKISTDPSIFWLVAYSGLFSTGFAYALWNYGVRRVGPSHASIYQNFVPIIAITSGLFIVNEVPGGVQIPGGILILGGLILMRRGR
jgi:drug/metabolite transporter (DMT)-like permease